MKPPPGPPEAVQDQDLQMLLGSSEHRRRRPKLEHLFGNFH